MLTILELGHAEGSRLEGLRALLDGAGADIGLDTEVKWVFVQPGRGQWTRACGRQVIVEHVQGPRWSVHTPERALVEPRRLVDLVHLYRPSAIVCRSPLFAPVLARVVGLRLQPRPVFICTSIDDSAQLWAQRRLDRLGPLATRARALGSRAVSQWSRLGLGSFDAVFVTSKIQARRLRERGVRGLYYMPRGADLDRFRPCEEDESPVSNQVFIDAPAGVMPERVGELVAELCRTQVQDPRFILHAPAMPRLEPLLARRPQLRLCPPDDLDARAQALRTSAVALIVPGFDDGRSAVAEAMASGCPVVAAGARAEQVGIADAGVVVEDSVSHSKLAAGLVAGVVEVLGRDDRLASGARARAGIEGHPLRRSLARELDGIRDLIERVRGAGASREGLRELEPSARTLGLGVGGREP